MKWIRTDHSRIVTNSVTKLDPGRTLLNENNSGHLMAAAVHATTARTSKAGITSPAKENSEGDGGNEMTDSSNEHSL
jgi:hypothetical protein